MEVSRRPLLRREMQSLRPPLPFSGENFLPGRDNGRDRLIRGQFGLGWKVKETGNHGRFPNDSTAKYCAMIRFEIRACFGLISYKNGKIMIELPVGT